MVQISNKSVSAIVHLKLGQGVCTTLCMVVRGCSKHNTVNFLISNLSFVRLDKLKPYLVHMQQTMEQHVMYT